MRRPTPVFAALAVACATALAACAPTSTTSPTDPIGYRCPGPTPGAPEQTCSQAEYEQAQREADQFADASETYREFSAEMDRVLATGGAKEATARMQELATGTFLTMMTSVVKEHSANGYTNVGTVSISAIERLETDPDAVVSLQACEDGRKVRVRSGDGAVTSSGRITRTSIHLTSSDGRLKIYRGSSQVVSSCGGLS